jgi:peroxiredoxin
MNLTKVLLFSALPFLLLACGTSLSMAAEETVPEVVLNVPESDFHKQYLGLEESSTPTFSIGDIEADILVVELFSMYCPYCQKEAPAVNELYEKMEKSKKGVSVKIIGIGASNSQFEVEHFRETYNVPFPLFPDKDLSIYKAFQGNGTPGFVGIRLTGDGAPVIVLRNSGGFYSADDFLKELIEKSGH